MNMKQKTLSVISFVWFVTCSLSCIWAQHPGFPDPNYRYSPGFSNEVNDMVCAHDGKIYVGGKFTMHGGYGRPHLARLNSDGTLDKSYYLSVNGEVLKMDIDSNGDVVIVGHFSQVGGSSRNKIAKIKGEGAGLDPDFLPGSGAQGSVYCVAVDPDDKILIGGAITNYNGTTVSRMAHINADGSLDSYFQPSIQGSVYDINISTGRTVAIGGNFTSVNGYACGNLAILLINGAPSPNFLPLCDSSVHAVEVDHNGRILAGGNFSAINCTII